MPRILVGGFGPVARRGIRAILEREGVDIVAECGLDVVMTVLDPAAHDVLVLDFDDPDGSALAAAVTRAHPEVTVVACSAARPVMWVYPRHGGQPVQRRLSAGALAAAVKS